MTSNSDEIILREISFTLRKNFTLKTTECKTQITQATQGIFTTTVVFLTS